MSRLGSQVGHAVVLSSNRYCGVTSSRWSHFVRCGQSAAMRYVRAFVVFICVAASCCINRAEAVDQCAWTDPNSGRHYDLSSMRHSEDYEKVVQMGLSIKFIYQFNVCANTISSCGSKTGSSIETLQLSSGKNCRILGSFLGAHLLFHGFPRLN